MPRERMQYDRRVDKVPMTWEPWFGALVVLAFFVLISAQIARTLANLLAGAGWTWPTSRDPLVSSFAVLAGHAAAGLAQSPDHLAAAGLLATCVVLVELTALGLFTGALVNVLAVWGPQRMLGMATRPDAESVLGVTRLRRHATVIRPDLYGPGSNRSRPEQQPRTRPLLRTVEEYQAEASASAETTASARWAKDPEPTMKLPVVPRSSLDPDRRWV